MMSKAQLFDEIKSLVNLISCDKRFVCTLNIAKTRTTLSIVIRRAVDFKAPQKALSREAEEARHRVIETLEQLRVAGTLLDVKIKNTKKGLHELIQKLKEIQEQKDELVEQFTQRFSNMVDELEYRIAELRRLNSIASKAMRERAKKEREAIKEGRFEEASDKRIKEFLHRLGFKNIVILDKSSRYRAVTFAKVELDYREEGNWGVMSTWLAGVDDTGMPWSVPVGPHDRGSLLSYRGLTVEDQMAIAFGVYPDVLEDESTMLQGDVLVFHCKEEEVQEWCGYLKYSPQAMRIRQSWDPRDIVFRTAWKNIDDDYTEFSSLDIATSHVLQAPQGRVKRIEAVLLVNDKPTMTRQLVYHVVLPEGGTLTHKEHAPLTLAPGEYAIVLQINAFGAD